MSGGRFDYDQYRIGQIADQIQHEIECNDDMTLDEWGCTKGRGYDAAVIHRFKEAVRALRVAEIYAQRIDWLLSGDDGEESFIRRLDQELYANPSHETASAMQDDSPRMMAIGQNGNNGEHYE